MSDFRVIATGMLGENCYLVRDAARSRLFIIDPGDDADLIISAARDMNCAENVILLTHAHVDHIGAVPEVAQSLGIAAIFLADGDKMLYRSPENHILPYLPAVADLPETTSEWPWETPELILTPGHSPGGSCFYFREQKLLIAGDTLFADSVGRTDLPGGDFATLEKSIRENLLCLPDEVKVYPGHGPSTTIGQERRSNPYLQ